MKEKSMFGKLLSSVNNARWEAKAAAQADLWKRNDLANPVSRKGYKMAETTAVQRDGTEVTEYRLYKLIDASVVTVSSSVQYEVETGADKLTENKNGD